MRCVEETVPEVRNREDRPRVKLVTGAKSDVYKRQLRGVSKFEAVTVLLHKKRTFPVLLGEYTIDTPLLLLQEETEGELSLIHI